jgi:glycosyltransferase involved in cell wall biosynthesis
LTALAKARGVGHLHAHFAEAATTVAMLASRLSGVSFSFTAHAWDIYDRQSVGRAFLKEKIRRARFVVTVSDYNRRALRLLCGEEASRKIIRVYNGIDLSRFHPDPSVAREADFILAVGRLVEKKGFHHLIHACRLLRDKGLSFRCLIVGEGEERERLTRQIETLRVGTHVRLIGAQAQEQVVKMMREATVLVLPCVISASGDRDALPTVLLEALAVGLPAISTTVAGIPEIIEHGKTGFLVPPGDSISLAATIEEVLDNPRLRERSASGGIRKARRSFDIRKNVRILQEQFARTKLVHGRLRV